MNVSRSEISMRKLGLLGPLFLLLTALATGCAGDVTAGGMKEMEMYAVADGGGEGSGASASRAPDGTSARADLSAPATGTLDLATAGLEGILTFTVAATLIDVAGAETVVTSSSTVSLQLEAADSTRFADRRVPRVEYRTLRLAFSQVEAYVDAGLVIGGVPRPGPLRVGIPAGGQVVLDVPVELTNPARAHEQLIVDMNASQWMQAVNVVTGIVSVEAFRAAVRVRHR